MPWARTKLPIPRSRAQSWLAVSSRSAFIWLGPEDRLRSALQEATGGEELPIVIVPAAEWITMDEKAATAIRKKPGSSMRVGLRLVKENKVAGFLTAGNTGAAMALAKMVLGALPGVDRPSLSALLPTSTGSRCVLLDVGANVDCKPHNLEQFAVMGEMYARSVLKIPRPRVGLLSIGEEEGKGNDLTREAFPLLKQLSINFIGNVEGRDIYNGNADVVVCDGFVGNVALKTSEGLARLVRDLLRQSLNSTVTAQVGALLSRKAFNDFKKRLDYSEYGGAPLLGIRGVCIVNHGSSNDRAIYNGIRVTAEFAQAGINQRLEQEFASAGRRMRNPSRIWACLSSHSTRHLDTAPMSKTAFLFPGQGSQSVGMGRDLADAFPIARQTFEEANDALGFDLAELCFSGPEEQLRLTEFTQPAIFTVSVAALRVLAAAGATADYFAGHSLGEYSANVAAGTIEFAAAARTVRRRGQLMQQAVPAGQGAMAAILGMPLEAVIAVCQDASREVGGAGRAGQHEHSRTNRHLRSHRGGRAGHWRWPRNVGLAGPSCCRFPHPSIAASCSRPRMPSLRYWRPPFLARPRCRSWSTWMPRW